VVQLFPGASVIDVTIVEELTTINGNVVEVISVFFKRFRGVLTVFVLCVDAVWL